LQRRVVFLDVYYDSVAMLDDSPETAAAVALLEYEAAYYPERTPPLAGMYMRVIRTASPGLRLFYWIEDDVVNIIHIEPYDELAR